MYEASRYVCSVGHSLIKFLCVLLHQRKQYKEGYSQGILSGNWHGSIPLSSYEAGAVRDHLTEDMEIGCKDGGESVVK